MGEEPGVATVVAAQRGDQAALDRLVGGYLPLVYNVVGHALGGHADTDDVVQETMLRAVHGLAGLRDPAGFRSWLVVIAMNLVRDRHRRRTPEPVSDDGLRDLADPGADFVDLTILRLQLGGQRRDVVAATRWLSDDERELLALWWLECAGRLTRAEVAEAAGLTPGHAAVRVQRMKAQLDAARAVTRALREAPRCPELAELTADWDGVPSALWRKRVARHVRECRRCGHCAEGLAAAEALVGRLPLVPVPVGLPLLAHPAAPVVAKTPFLGTALGKAVAAVAVVAAATAVVLALPSRPEPATRAAIDPTPTTTATTTEAVATTTPRPTTAASSAVPPARSTTRAAAPPAAASAKKGVAAWSATGVSDALADVGAGWFYTWASSPEDIAVPPGVEFVPMIWGPGSVTDANLARAAAQGDTLLGFNEPDLGEQSAMTVEQALDLWPRLEATGQRLGSPAVAYGGDRPDGWLDRFMAGAESRGLRVDFITLHWYGSDFGPNAVDHLRSYVDAVHERYGKPIWLTEYGLIDFSGGAARYPDQTAMAAFAGNSATMLESLPYVERYAWFGLIADNPAHGLYADGDTPNPAGTAYRAAG